jgi:hypothetical protein
VDSVRRALKRRRILRQQEQQATNMGYILQHRVPPSIAERAILGMYDSSTSTPL